MNYISVAVPSPVCVQESESSKYTGPSESIHLDLPHIKLFSLAPSVFDNGGSLT
jgi:hypothetical protein